MILLKAVFLLNALVFSSALPNIIDALTANGATTLVSLIDQAGLTDTLKTKGPFTIFAPTNEAISKVPSAYLQTLNSDVDALKNVLLYHVVNGEMFTLNIATKKRLFSINNHTIKVYSGDSGKHYFNQALAIKEDVQASNGVIYLIDEVLNVPEGTIWDILNNPDYNLTQFAAYTKNAHFYSLFMFYTSATRYTLFAPMDSAFKSLPPALGSSSLYARRIIEYHTHRGALYSASLSKDGTISTMYPGHTLRLTHDARNFKSEKIWLRYRAYKCSMQYKEINDKTGIQILGPSHNTGDPLLNNLGMVVIQDIEAENGVVHVITDVLIPSTMAGIVG